MRNNVKYHASIQAIFVLVSNRCVSGVYYTYIDIDLFCSRNDTRDKNNEQTRSKTHKAQRALTAASKKERKNTQTNRQTMTTVSEALHKLVKSTLEIEHLNLDNVLKSAIFTGSECQVFMTRSLKSLLWFVRQPIFI